jgi:hypothetical protein
MSNLEPAPSVEASVLLSASELVARLCDRRPDAHTFFEGIDDPQRPALAAEAWSIGLRALSRSGLKVIHFQRRVGAHSILSVSMTQRS